MKLPKMAKRRRIAKNGQNSLIYCYNFTKRESLPSHFHAFLHHSTLTPNALYYGTSTDAIRAIKFNGKVALMSPMNLDQAMSRLHTASIQSFVVFITVPESLKDGGVEDCEFEDDELSDIQGKEHERLVEQSREIFRKFNGQIDRVIVKRDFESCFNQLEGISFSLMNDQQWVPSRWIK